MALLIGLVTGGAPGEGLESSETRRLIAGAVAWKVAMMHWSSTSGAFGASCTSSWLGRSFVEPFGITAGAGKNKYEYKGDDQSVGGWSNVTKGNDLPEPSGVNFRQSGGNYSLFGQSMMHKFAASTQSQSFPCHRQAF
jgi:hypothetical protein